MKGRFLASVSPQLIDLPLQKDWYVSLQTPRQDDLKLAVEQFKSLALDICTLHSEEHIGQLPLLLAEEGIKSHSTSNVLSE